MHDIFISYAREDRAQAERLAHAFEGRGWQVWWDRHIVPGQNFDREIEAALDAARAVVVLWSPAAVASDWVRNEAGAAQDRGVLVPAQIADAPLPLEFRRRQAAQLQGWDGSAGHAGFAALCEGVARLLEGAAPSARATARPAPPPTAAGVPGGQATGARAGRSWAGLAAMGVVGVALVVLAWWRPWQPRASEPAPMPAGVAVPAAPAGRASARGTSAAAGTTAGTGTSADAEEDLAQRIAGRYMGEILSDIEGPSRSRVGLTIIRIDAQTVRIHSDDEARLNLDRLPLEPLMGKTVTTRRADTTFLFEWPAEPGKAPTVGYNPPNTVLAYFARRISPP